MNVKLLISGTGQPPSARLSALLLLEAKSFLPPRRNKVSVLGFCGLFFIRDHSNTLYNIFTCTGMPVSAFWRGMEGGGRYEIKIIGYVIVAFPFSFFGV